MANLYAYIDGNYVEADYLNGIPYDPSQSSQIVDDPEYLYFEAGYIDDGYLTTQNPNEYFLDGYIDDGYLVTQNPGEYYLDGYIDDGYFESIKEASCQVLSYVSVYALLEKVQGEVKEFDAALVGEFAQACQGGVIFDVSADMSAEFTSTTVLSNIYGADLFAFTDALLEAQVSVIRDNNVEVSSVFDVATDFVRYRDDSVDAAALFDAIINGLRSRDTTMETQAAFSLTCTAERFVGFDSLFTNQFIIGHLDENGQFVPDIKPDVVYEFTQAFDLTTSLTSTGIRNRLNSSQMVVGSAVYARGFKRYERPLEVYQNNITSINTSIKKFGDGSLQFNSNTSYLKYYGSNALIPQPGQLSNHPQKEFAVEFWYYPTANRIGPIVNFGDGTLTYWSLNGNMSFSYLRDDQNITETPLFNLGSPTINSWNHILLVIGDGTKVSLYLNGQRLGTANISYGIRSTTRGYLQISPTVDADSPVGYIDELRVLAGPANTMAALGYNPINTTITVPTEPFVNTTNTRFLGHYNVDFSDDISEQESAQANLAAQFTVVANLTGPVKAEAAMTATASVAASLTKIAQFAANLNAEFQATADAIRIRPLTSNLTAEFTVSVEVNRERNIELQMFDIAELAAEASRTRDLAASLSSEFDVVADTSGTSRGQADLSAEFALASDAVRIHPGQAALASESTVSATADRIKPLAAELSTISEIAATGNSTLSAAAALSAEFTVFAQIKHIEGVDLQMFAVADLSAAPDVIRGLASDIQAQSQTTADASRILGIAATLNSNTTLSALAGNRISGSSQINSVFTVTAAGTSVHIEEIVYVIPPEDRTWTISKEYFSWTIEQEDRNYIVRR